MAVDTVASSQAATQDTTALGRARLADNFSTFLSLLTAQLKNQDPLSPLDSNQFTQQLVQMTGVEQQLATNDLLKQLVSNTASGVASAVSLIGKDVRAVSDTANLANGKASWTYKLSTAATDTKIEVLDSKGGIVHAEAATDNKAGDHAFTWNGKGLTGSTLPDGPYTLRITAKNGADSVPSTTYVQGTVTGVEQADGATYITINGGKVTWDKVTSINQAAAAATNSVVTPTTPSTPAVT